MLTKNDAQFAELVNAIKSIFGGNTAQIILYGSYARGDNTQSSDIDLMVLTNLHDTEIAEMEDDIADTAFDYELKEGVPVSINVKNLDHFTYWKNTLPYYRNIAKEGIILA